MRGRLHPAITNVFTTHEVKKMRPHVKMLVGNYLTLEEKSLQSGGSPFCQLCLNEDEPKVEVVESIEHLISTCIGLNETRSNIISSMKNLIHLAGLRIEIDKFSPKELTQFLLDPSSLNLAKRVSISHPILPNMFQLSRDFCYKIDRCRQNTVT